MPPAKVNDMKDLERLYLESVGKRNSNPNLRRNFLLKAAVLLSIAGVASVIGYSAFALIRDNEYQQYENDYNVFATQIIPSTTQGTYCKIRFVSIPSVHCVVLHQKIQH